MKTLIVYFSYSQNTKAIAEYIHDLIPKSDLIRIELKDDRKLSKWYAMIKYGFNTIFKRKMPIKKVEIDWAEYERVIIGSPVWVGNAPPPLLSFIESYEFNLLTLPVSVFCSCGSDPGNYFNEIGKRIGNEKVENRFVYIESAGKGLEEVKSDLEGFVFRMKKGVRFSM